MARPKLDARKIDRKALEAIRIRAVQRVQAGRVASVLRTDFLMG